MRSKLLLSILLASFVIGAGMLRRGHDWGDDFAWYILQAKSILNGTTEEFIEQSIFTNTQSTTHVGPLAYPWGYPLILVPPFAINGISPLTLKLPGLFFYVGFLVCLYFLVVTRLTPTESLLIVALFAFDPMMLQFLDQILSDIPFLFFSTLTLLLMTRESGSRPVQHGLIGMSIFFTAFLRATGILLLGSFLIIRFFKLWRGRRDREAVKQMIRDAMIVCMVFAALWAFNALSLPGGGESYLSQYSTITPEIIKGFAAGYFKVFSQFFGKEEGWKYLYYVVFVFFLIGAWARRKDETIFILFFVLWMLVHVTYPYWQGARYIFPLLPIFIYFAFQGMKTAVHKLPEAHRKNGERIFQGFWLLLIAIFLLESGAAAYNNVKNGRTVHGAFDPVSMEVYQYINEKTPPGSVIVFFKPRVILLMTDHPTIMSTECDRMLRGDYIVLSKKVGENQQIPPERIRSCDLPLNRVFENRRFIIYEVQKGS